MIRWTPLARRLHSDDMKRSALAVLLGGALVTGLACSIGPESSCGTFVSACSPIPPSDSAGPGPTDDAWPEGAAYNVAATTDDGHPYALADPAVVTFHAPYDLEVVADCYQVVVRADDLANDRLVVLEATGRDLDCESGNRDDQQWFIDFFEAMPTLVRQGDILTFRTPDAAVQLMQG